MIGKTLLHYKILEKLGEGGMGVVYKAKDLKLERDVAIKFLPGQLARKSTERERFEIEAKAAATLNHPNIATIYAIEEAESPASSGQRELFIAMEYIEGKELKELMEEGALNLNDTLDIAERIADGLKSAHKKAFQRERHERMKKDNIVHYKADKLRKTAKTDWKRLDAMSDNDIDTSEIPELDEEWFKNAKVVFTEKKKAISLRVDAEVLEWFKSNSKRRGYQTLMNAVLKAYVHSGSNLPPMPDENCHPFGGQK